MLKIKINKQFTLKFFMNIQHKCRNKLNKFLKSYSAVCYLRNIYNLNSEVCRNNIK